MTILFSALTLQVKKTKEKKSSKKSPREAFGVFLASAGGQLKQRPHNEFTSDSAALGCVLLGGEGEVGRKGAAEKNLEEPLLA